MLLGPMGQWCPRGCQKLCSLVRKPVAALPGAAKKHFAGALKPVAALPRAAKNHFATLPIILNEDGVSNTPKFL